MVLSNPKWIRCPRPILRYRSLYVLVNPKDPFRCNFLEDNLRISHFGMTSYNTFCTGYGHASSEMGGTTPSVVVGSFAVIDDVVPTTRVSFAFWFFGYPHVWWSMNDDRPWRKCRIWGSPPQIVLRCVFCRGSLFGALRPCSDVCFCGLHGRSFGFRC